MYAARFVVFLFVLIPVALTTKVKLTGDIQYSASTKVTDVLSDLTAEATLTNVLDELGNMVCQACSKINDPNKKSKCRKKLCTDRAKSSYYNLSDKEKLRKFIEAKVAHVNKREHITILPIITDVMCKLCKKIEDQKRMEKCKKKYCSFTL